MTDEDFAALRINQAVDRILLVELLNALENEREERGARSIIDLLDKHIGAVREQFAAQAAASQVFDAALSCLADLRRSRQSRRPLGH